VSINTSIRTLNSAHSDTIKTKGLAQRFCGRGTFGDVIWFNEAALQQIIALEWRIKRLWRKLRSGLAMKSRSTGGTRF
jgi:hypothetical protein